MLQKIKGLFKPEDKKKRANEMYFKIVGFHDDLEYYIKESEPKKIYVFQTLEEIDDFNLLGSTIDTDGSYPHTHLKDNFRRIEKECKQRGIKFEGVAVYKTKYRSNTPKMVHYGEINNGIPEYTTYHYKTYQHHPLVKGLEELTKLYKFLAPLGFRRDPNEYEEYLLELISTNANYVDYLVKLDEISFNIGMFSELASREEEWLDNFFAPLYEINEVLGLQEEDSNTEDSMANRLDRLVNWSSTEIHSVELPE